jgi:[acyl-carrier-protein] S-malonyltransferase
VKTAFVYPGQGSQRPAMGAELKEAEPELYGRYVGLADEVSGLPVSRTMAEGSIEELTDTAIAQPAIFALSLALTELARKADVLPAFVAGHSLGEYTAVVSAGVLSVEDGMRLVSLRGRLMADAQRTRPGAMAAILGLPALQVEEVCRAAGAMGTVVPANLNTPIQTVISGDVPAVDRAIELALADGAEQATRLQVGAAFHSPLMEPVQRELAVAINEVSWRDASVPLITNSGGHEVTDAAEVRQALIDQVTSPVRWEAVVRRLLELGSQAFLELGPGRVLNGLIRQIEPDADVSAVDSPRKLQAFVSSHAG